MQKCPVCNGEVNKSEIVCMSCRDKIILNEPLRKHERIRGVADMIVIFLALFFFLKGAYMLLGLEGYMSFVENMGFPITSNSLHYWNASICILAALGYSITALGNYLNSEWTNTVCRASLLFLIIGQLIMQIGDISDEFITAEAFSVVCLLGCLPVLQYVMCLMSKKQQSCSQP